ncbi:MAG: hypothetical protein ACRBB3_10080 [Alphaproteobacteria bacterium]
MTQDVTNEDIKRQNTWKAIVIGVSLLVVFLILLDTYYDQQKPRETRPLVPFTFTPPPEVPEELFNQEQDTAQPAQGSVKNEQ